MRAMFVTTVLSGCIGVSCGQPAMDELDPGVSLRVWHVGQPLERVAQGVDGVTPNLDERRAVIDFEGFQDFAPRDLESGAFEFEDFYIAEVSGWVRADEPGAYVFRLSSDDGSLLTIDGERVVWNRGVHPVQAMVGVVNLDPGLHELRVLFFESAGGEALRLEWQTPGSDGFEIIPESSLYTEANVTRVVSPGRKPTSATVEGLRPGDRIPLETAHPSYTIQDLHPADWNPMVGCLAWLPDGRLIVGEFEPRNNGVWLTEPNGTLWALSNLPGPGGDPEQIRVEVFAEGFYHPLGMVVVDSTLYVAERDRISYLKDIDGDGTWETRGTLAEGWVNDNYHHFTFGLEHRDGFLYATLSTSIGAGDDEVLRGEIVGINGPNPANRGTLMKISLETGEIEYVAGGFRTPNGVLVDSQGRVFTGENQGAWHPASRVNHVRPGHFYGHYNETGVRTTRYPDGGAPALFSDQPTSLPALWLPQNEAANSPTDFLEIPSGRFAGQLLIGELKLGGIRRASLETVHGVVQGAVFRSSQGFEGGINRLLWGPEINGEPSIVVGCIGEQATWSWRGTRTGLQWMIPTGDHSTFEFHSMHATEDGFELHLTQPGDVDSLRDLSNYSALQWRYAPTPNYGGAKVDLEALPITAAEPTSDGMSVRLTIPGLQPGRCVYLHADITGADEQPIWSPEAWYTLNEIPGQPTQPLAYGPVPALNNGEPSFLVFSKTAGFRHGSIESGVDCFERLADREGYRFEHTEDSGVFNDDDLRRFDAVVFLNTTQDVLNLAQQSAFERYIRGGGGFMGIHAAADTEYEWPWYGELVGAYFSGHPRVQPADVVVEVGDHACTSHLPDGTWERTDEWYNYKDVNRDSITVLLTLDESSYEGGDMLARGEPDHPIAWCHEFDGGRAFYTGGGHTNESFREPLFVEHLLGGLRWTMGLEDD